MTRRPAPVVAIDGVVAALLASLPDGLILLDGRGLVIACNPAAARMIGRPSSHVVGAQVTSLFEAERALPPGTLHPHDPVFDVIRNDGTRAWLSVSTAPLPGGDGARTTGALLRISDISHGMAKQDAFEDSPPLAPDLLTKKRVEDELHQSEELSRAVLSSLTTRIGVLDRNGVITEVNDGWRRFERDDRLAAEPACLPGVDYLAARAGIGSSGDAIAGEATRSIRAVLRGSRRRADLEYRVDSVNGARWFALHVERLRTERGGAVVSHVETTMRRTAEEADIRRIAAEQSERAKTDLLNVVSHELRTPLAVIRGHMTTALEYGDRLTAAQRVHGLQATDAAARQLERLVGDLLTMGRIDAGVMRMDRQLHALVDILGEAVEGVEGIARQSIEIEAPRDALEAYVDYSRVLQVFYNLLDNACKYGSVGAPIRIEARHAKPSMALVTVVNRCTGIHQSHINDIFERFHRTDHGMQVNGRGTGLGLSISKGIVEAHDGRIWARVRGDVFRVHVLLPKSPPSEGQI